MNDILKARKVTDIKDRVVQKEVQKTIISTICEQLLAFQDAFAPRRRKLLEINALYRNKSYYDEFRADWQTKSFIPLAYEAVEAKTSIIHQNLWGDKFNSPFTAIGKTPEDNSYANIAEQYLNNTFEKIKFFRTSQKCARSTAKNGKGVYRYGWERRTETHLNRELVMDGDKVKRNSEGEPIYKYNRKEIVHSQPFIRTVDIIDHFFYDPNATEISKWKCGYVGEIREESTETIARKEADGEYDAGSTSRLKSKDPHALKALEDMNSSIVELRTNDELNPQVEQKNVHHIIDYFGWLWIGDTDKDGNKQRKFVHVVLADKKVILSAEEWIIDDYPFIEIPYVESLHTLNSTGVIDPAIELIYEINEYHNQRGDAIKLALNKQFAVNMDMVFDDHDYESYPGAMHPFASGDRPVRDAIQALDFNVPTFISAQEEQLDLEYFARATGHSDINGALTSTNKDTPATTVVSLLNEQQATASMVINGIMERHAQLASRIFRLLQLFGDEKFRIKSLGRKGIEIREESLENILGEFDFSISTSTFMGNKAIELQQMINYKQFAMQSPHIDQVEYDRAILEGIVPKRIDKILVAPEEPISPEDEQILFLYGQAEELKVNQTENRADLTDRIRKHDRFKSTQEFSVLDPQSKQEFEDYLDKLKIRLEQLLIAEQQQQQKSQNPQSQDGNQNNLGSPLVRELGNSVPFPGQQ